MSLSHYFQINCFFFRLFLPTPINNNLIQKMFKDQEDKSHPACCKNVGAGSKSQAAILRQTNCRYPRKAAQQQPHCRKQ